MTFWDNPIADFFRKPQTELNTPTAIQGINDTQVDWTDDLKVNYALTYGLYHNSYPGIKLAGFGYNAIAVPVSFMGYPVPTTDNERANEQLEFMLESFSSQMEDIHTQTSREGTVWIYPRYSASNGLYWEFIRDDTISKIIKSIATGEVIRIETKEQLKISVENDDNPVYVNRTRVFTKTKVIVKHDRQIPGYTKDKSSRNPAGVLPIPFANNADGGYSRGHSDYERIVTDLKNYHDTDLAESQTLNNFKTKQVQTVKNVDTWIKNNGFDSGEDFAANYSLFNKTFILNEQDEKTELLEPSRLTDPYQAKLKQIFRKIVELSGIPEIAWGLKTEGNLASVEENMAILMRYVEKKQRQIIEPYQVLFTASLRLYYLAGIISSSPEVTVKWNNLNNLSEKTRSEIFKNMGETISKLINSGAWTMEMLHEYMLQRYPDITPAEYEEFETGITAMTAHAARARASLMEQLDSQGG